MKVALLGILLIILFAGCTQMADKKETIKGQYLEGKLGPYVNGILLDQDFQEQYRGKTVEVIGTAYIDDSFEEGMNEKGEYVQSTGSPIKRMKNITSIKIVK
ncbi:hypothetical protein HYT84_00775 [Candidatus Micrarchaeota archaeon]|nr:hypothetical protein [Candidatus Micrarchaeota archaeon]